MYKKLENTMRKVSMIIFIDFRLAKEFTIL